MPISRREALLLCAAPVVAQVRPKVAITLDDVQWQKIPEARRAEAEDRLLSSLSKTKSFLFAIGRSVDNEHGERILKSWSSAGHHIGNHTYDHVPLTGQTTPEAFEAGILRTDNLLRMYAGFRKWFRFPALKEGRTPEVRDRLRAFLELHGYRNGSVTIDTSDWYYNQRLQDRLEADKTFDVRRYRQPYLDHIWDRAQYYDQLSVGVLGRHVAHTLLVHFNLLSSLFLADVLEMFRSQGWGIVDADEAFSDPVFDRRPDIAPAGESLIWALAKETGKFGGSLRYPGEDDTYEKPLLDRAGI
jgi:peptidoglycan/xylan/chitin deacetylase (PgdA/CDA1 family)